MTARRPPPHSEVPRQTRWTRCVWRRPSPGWRPPRPRRAPHTIAPSTGDSTPQWPSRMVPVTVTSRDPGVARCVLGRALRLFGKISFAARASVTWTYAAALREFATGFPGEAPRRPLHGVPRAPLPGTAHTPSPAARPSSLLGSLTERPLPSRSRGAGSRRLGLANNKQVHVTDPQSFVATAAPVLDAAAPCHQAAPHARLAYPSDSLRQQHLPK